METLPGQVPESDPSHGVLPQDGTPAGHEVVSPTAKKRRQGGAESSRKRHGKRRELCRLNLDVLFLIAAYIHPMDLLNLARTCKSLRELLMDKASTFVWKTARRQVDLPDCPADLTEPQYAHLAYCARCNGCGKTAKAVMWKIRRRYCLSCKQKRLCHVSSCDEVIRNNDVLAMEHLTLNKQSALWVDRDQMNAFMSDYRSSADKEQFLDDKKAQYKAICQHGDVCEGWKENKDLEHSRHLTLRQEERQRRIFERLQELGYEPEIKYFGEHTIQGSHKSVFKTSKQLTTREWDRMRPRWLQIMDTFRSRRLDVVVYQQRRSLLAADYDTYVMCPTPDAPTFDFLPHVVDLACFDSFQNVIKAPEGTPMDDRPFASAFAQLPDSVDGWKENLVTELVELVKIPAHLFVEDASNLQDSALSSTGHAEPSNKLNLGCALFRSGRIGPFTYLNVLSIYTHELAFPWREPEPKITLSDRDRLGIEFLAEAPYIVHTCGLDPCVATMDDLDRRNARLRCLCCRSREIIVMNWRAAMSHASTRHKVRLTPLSEAPRWQLVSDEHIGAIQAVEQTLNKELPYYKRCLLCRRRVGDALCGGEYVNHFACCHKIPPADIKQGVHYVPLGICNSPAGVKMVEGRKVTFEVSTMYSLSH